MAAAKKISVKKPVKKLTGTKPVVKKATGGISIPLYGAKGEKTGDMSLDKKYFGLPWNDQLVSQAVRVYRQNQRVGNASTKTRGEVSGSTRKLFKQKGTGKARRGNIRAPIMVGGGIVFGPQPRDYSKTLSRTMRRVALLTALSHKCKIGEVIAIEGLETLPLKTKSFAKILLPITHDRRFVILLGDKTAPTLRAMKNMEKVRILPVQTLTTNDVMIEKTVVFTKDAMEQFIEYIAKA